MSLQYYYSPSDTVASIDITDHCRLYRLDVTMSAEEGAVGASTLIVDDPDGTLDIVGLKNIVISETLATGSNTIIGSFVAAERTIDRGPFEVGAARQWTVSLLDVNTIASWRVHVGGGNNRPAETDVQRMQWLMGTSELGQVADTTFLDTSGPVAMDAVDYNGQTSIQVLDDCAQASGKNYFIYYRQASLTPALWYGFSGSTAYTSSIRLSNDLDDIVNDAYGLTFAISDDTTLERSPSRVNSGAYVPFDGGNVYEQRASIYDAFRRRDAVMPSLNVKSRAKATARAQRYLDVMATEEDRITTSYRVPAAQVNFMREGMRCQFRATHLPGYEGPFQYMRALSRKVKQDSEESYLVTLVLSGESTTVSVPAAGPGSVYFYGDNGVEVWVNGTFIGDNSSNHKTSPSSVAGGVIVSGDNVLAIRVTNGVEPATWDLGNVTFLEARLYPATGGTEYVSTGSTIKTWDVSNFPSGTLGGTPANWNTAAFDDAAWAAGLDVTSNSTVMSVNPTPPISPARYIAPSGALTGTYARGLVWLARMNFTAS